MPLMPLAAHYRQLLASSDPVSRNLAREQLRRLAGTAKQDQTPREQTANPDDRLVAAIEAVGGPLTIRSDGRRVGPCPWHSSKTGACLVVWPTEGRWWCSSCRRGGGLVQWTALVDGSYCGTARRKLRIPRQSVEATDR